MIMTNDPYSLLLALEIYSTRETITTWIDSGRNGSESFLIVYKLMSELQKKWLVLAMIPIILDSWSTTVYYTVCLTKKKEGRTCFWSNLENLVRRRQWRWFLCGLRILFQIVISLNGWHKGWSIISSTNPVWLNKSRVLGIFQWCAINKGSIRSSGHNDWARIRDLTHCSCCRRLAHETPHRLITCLLAHDWERKRFLTIEKEELGDVYEDKAS